MQLIPLQSAPGLVEQVRQRLVAAIVEGTLGPGQRLTQETVAEMLGVSRQPVSHALQSLRDSGLLVEHGRRGLMVAPIDAGRMRELYQIRSALDALAAGLAAGRVAAGLVEAGERRAVDAVLQHGMDLQGDAGVAAFVAADVAFHTAIYRLSGNAAIIETLADSWSHFQRCMAVVLARRALRPKVWMQHRAILAAIWQGDAQEAERLAGDHARRAARDTIPDIGSDKSVA